MSFEPFARKNIAEIGIIGGSGFYELASDLEEIKVETPFGSPSDFLTIGKISGKRVAFLPRHGRHHTIPPHVINYRANLWALHSLGVKEIIAINACGSLQKKIRPGSVVVLDQFIDRTNGRKDTFYNGPEVTHVSSAYPYCQRIDEAAAASARKLNLITHPKGTMVVIQGPRFSTAAESLWFTKMGWEVIGMTQYPEVVLARELQMCYGALAFPTDFDAGLVTVEKMKPVSAREVSNVFRTNIKKAKELVLQIVEDWPKREGCDCGQALESARS